MQHIDRAKTGLTTWLHALQTHTESRSSRFSSWFSRTGVLDNFDQLSCFGSVDFRIKKLFEVLLWNFIKVLKCGICLNLSEIDQIQALLL